MYLFLGRNYVRQTCAQTNKDITISKPVSVSPCWLYSAIFVTCVRNDCCSHSLSVSPCRLFNFRSCDYFSAQSLIKWRSSIYVWNEIFHLRTEFLATINILRTTPLHFTYIEFICLVWYNPGVGCKHTCEEKYTIFFEKNTIPFNLLGANNLLYISHYSLI